MSIGVALLGLAVLILVHEAGHFFAARAVGMRPRKFYLGFPPAVLKKTRNGVEYGIGAIPFGGYVKIPGMHRPAAGDLRASLPPDVREEHKTDLAALDVALEANDDEYAREALGRLATSIPKSRLLEDHLDALAPDAYWRQAAWKRIVVIAAGPVTNIVVAILLFVVVFAWSSVHLTSVVHEVKAGKPGAAAGLRAGDAIVAIGGKQVEPRDFAPTINATAGRPFTITVVRAGKRVVLGPLQAAKDIDGAYRVGFVIGTETGPGKSLPDSFGASLHATRAITTGTLGGIWHLVHGKDTKNVSSVVGIVRETAAAYRASFVDYVGFVGAISLVLALANLLPLLPFDGGHIVMSALEGIRRKAFPQIVYVRYSAIGLSIFMLLLYLGLRNDIWGRS